jgi:hypothetical protein
LFWVPQVQVRGTRWQAVLGAYVREFCRVAAKRTIGLPLQEHAHFSAVCAEVAHITINFVARDKNVCLLLEKLRSPVPRAPRQRSLAD